MFMSEKRTSLTINVTLMILQTAEESTWTETSIQTTGSTVKETVVNATAVLEKMTAWKTQEGRSWNNPDHAMLWTR